MLSLIIIDGIYYLGGNVRKLVLMLLMVLMLAFALAASGCETSEPAKDVGSSGSEKETPSADPVDLIANVGFARGHLYSAAANIETNGEYGKMHAGHPIDEKLYAGFSKSLEEADPELNEELKEALEALPEEAVAKNAAAVTEVMDMLEEAKTKLVGAEELQNPAFVTQVIDKLLETAAHEYEEGVTPDGAIKNAEEYQDAYGFVQEVKHLFEGIEDQLPADKKISVRNLLDEIDRAYPEILPTTALTNPETVETTVESFMKELKEATG